jgi:hypothetical protein
MDSQSTSTDSGGVADADPGLLERDGELAALDGALASALAGRGRVVAVEPPA